MRGLGTQLAAFGPVAPPSPPLLDLATLNLVQYFDARDAVYTTPTANGLLTWPGRTSAAPIRNSGDPGYTLSNNPATQVAPTIGPTWNGKQTVLYAGAATEYLLPAVGGTPNPFLPDGAAKSFAWVFAWDSAGAPNHAPTQGYDNSALFCDWGTNRLNLCFRTGNVQACIYDGAFRGAEVPYVDNAPAIAMLLVDGTNAYLRIGSGAFTAFASGFLAAGAAVQNYGRSSDNSTKYKGVHAVSLMAPELWDAPTCAAIYARLASDWGIP